MYEKCDDAVEGEGCCKERWNEWAKNYERGYDWIINVQGEGDDKKRILRTVYRCSKWK